MRVSFRKVITVMALFALIASCKQKPADIPQISFEENLQQQLIEAEPGDTIEIPAGIYHLTRSLSLNVPGVSIKGEGINTSILSFKNQEQGAEGLLVSANDFTIEDLAIEDTVGDALKINQSNNVVIRNVRTEWTNGPATSKGAYGIYTVKSRKSVVNKQYRPAYTHDRAFFYTSLYCRQETLGLMPMDYIRILMDYRCILMDFRCI